jgi:DNA adenine methylase/adenine-specific DNA-methyltransferase
VAAFEGLFERFRRSILVLSYSSNGFPDLDVLVALMKRWKARVDVHEREHRYHFGTHDRVRRAHVREYLIVGS